MISLHRLIELCFNKVPLLWFADLKRLDQFGLKLDPVKGLPTWHVGANFVSRSTTNWPKNGPKFWIGIVPKPKIGSTRPAGMSHEYVQFWSKLIPLFTKTERFIIIYQKVGASPFIDKAVLQARLCHEQSYNVVSPGLSKVRTDSEAKRSKDKRAWVSFRFKGLRGQILGGRRSSWGRLYGGS